MEYPRYKPKHERPFGMGAFFDFGVAMAKHLAARASARRKKSPPAQPGGAQPGVEERWDGEGGNSQTRIARRASRYQR